MTTFLKNGINRVLRSLGYEMVRYHRQGLGADPLHDMRTILRMPAPVIFDVGANQGQSVDMFKGHFPDAKIFSFEPGAAAYASLQRTARQYDGVDTVQAALGRTAGTQRFFENRHSELGSLLEPGSMGLGEITGSCDVSIITLDEFCDVRAVEHIDILKIDTQGYELEVLEGGKQMLSDGRVSLVYLEVTFTDMYVGLPEFDVLYRLLRDCGFVLVAFYKFYYKGHITGWSDVLFARRELDRAVT